MTKKDLVKIIQEVVRREVQKEVKKLFIKENKSSLKSLAPKPRKVTKPIQKKEFVKGNDALNDVLNETVGLSKGDEMEEYPTMGNGTFDSTRMADAMGYGGMLGSAEEKRKMGALQTAQAAGVDTSNEAVQNVMQDLTKDYRGVMNALKKKDGKL